MNDSNSIIRYQFNWDCSCIMVGTNRGLRIFSTSPFELLWNSTIGGVGECAMLENTSLLAITGGGPNPFCSPRKLCLWNAKTENIMGDLDFETGIRAVQFNRTRLVVLCDFICYVYDTEDLTFLHEISSPLNSVGVHSKGILALSPNQHKSHLALPSDQIGEVCLYDIKSHCRMYNKIQAHQKALNLLKFSPNGRLLASCSVSGKIIRVFSIPSCEPLHSLHRGSSATIIHCLSFNKTSSLLAVAAQSSSIHLFHLVGQNNTKQKKMKTGRKCASEKETSKPASQAEWCMVEPIPTSDHEISEEMKKSEKVVRSHHSSNNPLNWKITKDSLGHGTCNVLRKASSGAVSQASKAASVIGTGIEKAYSNVNSDSTSALLPSPLSDFLTRTRSFTKVELSTRTEIKAFKMCGLVFSEELGEDVLMVVVNGLFHVYQVLEGECHLLQVHPLYETLCQDVSSFKRKSLEKSSESKNISR